jgi:muconolactone delta-isomerase
MKFLALEVELPGASAAGFAPHLAAEARHLWDLQQRGSVREAYFRPDRHTAVLSLECADQPEAERLLADFPLVRQGLIRFELIPLAPYSGYARLFAQ